MFPTVCVADSVLLFPSKNACNADGESLDLITKLEWRPFNLFLSQMPFLHEINDLPARPGTLNATVDVDCRQSKMRQNMAPFRHLDILSENLALLVIRIYLQQILELQFARSCYIAEMLGAEVDIS